MIDDDGIDDDHVDRLRASARLGDDAARRELRRLLRRAGLPVYEMIASPAGYPHDVVAQLRTRPLVLPDGVDPPTERVEHVTLVKHVDLRCISRVHPLNASSWFHPPMGEKRSKITARNLQTMGARSGPSDFIFTMPFRLSGRLFYGLTIELKRQLPASWSLKPAQEAFIASERVNGRLAEVCHGWREAAALVDHCYSRNP